MWSSGTAPGRSAGGSRSASMSPPSCPWTRPTTGGSREPGDALDVRIANLENGTRVFDATLAMRRRELSPALMTRVLLTYPPMSLAVPARIYANALRLKLKGARYHPHPPARAASGGDASDPRPRLVAR